MKKCRPLAKIIVVEIREYIREFYTDKAGEATECNVFPTIFLGYYVPRLKIALNYKSTVFDLYW